jgi:hypothetical protein
MEARMKRMRKAFIMGTMEAVRAEIIFLRALRRPKRRMTRKARMRRRMVMGMSTGPRATRDMSTTKASSMLHALCRKGRSQCANMFTASSKAKTMVKKRLDTSMACPSAVSLPASSARSWLNCASRRLAMKFCGRGERVRLRARGAGQGCAAPRPCTR